MRIPALLAVLLVPHLVSAATVTAFEQLPSAYNLVTSAGGAKYRLSHSNWDMSLSTDGGTFAGNFISHGVANVNHLNNLPMAFTLENLAGEGVIYSLAGGSYSKRLAWGSFVEDPCAAYSKGQCTTVKTINGDAAPVSFNAIHLAMRASRWVSGKSGSSMAWANLSLFGLTLQGDPLADGSVATTSSGKAGGTLLAATAGRWLIADANLAALDWKLSADVTGMRDISASGDEMVRFAADFKQVSVPEPSPAIYLATAAALFGAGRYFQWRRQARARLR
jgi:hypothetical protein